MDSTFGNRDPRVVLGGNLFGYTCSKAEAFRVMDAAEEVGIRRIDTANVYSNGQSEEIIGSWLERRGKRSDWMVYTKVGYRPEQGSSGLASAESIRSSLDGSLKRLGADSVFMLQLHRIDGTTLPTQTLEVVAALRSAGVIHKFGLSNLDISHESGRKWIPQMRAIDGIQQFGNWLMPRWIDSVAGIARPGCELLVYGVLGRGILTGKHLSKFDLDPVSRIGKSDRVRRDASDPELARLLVAARNIAASHDTDLLAVALEYVWQRRCLAIIGCRTADQVLELAKRFENRSEQSASALQHVRELVPSDAELRWDLGSHDFSRRE